MSIVVEGKGITRDYHVPGGLFGGARMVQALKGIDFAVERGKTLAIVGESGSGKSTLARIIALIDPASGGELKIDGQPVDIARRRPGTEMRSKVQMVFQNPYGSLNPRQKVGDVLMEPLIINTKIPASERRERAEAMLVKVGLGPEHFNRYPHMFSGGQRQRIAIARALMLNPALLVLDEPVSALDLSVQAQVLNLLRDLQEEFELTYVFVSHDLSVVRYIADDVMVISKGEAVEQGTREELFADPKHPYTRQLFAATPITDVDAIRARVERRKAARQAARQAATA
ncbi:ATP-binding cassette domain-containing protein [Agrobacterium pusense]|uniref:ATP-binding cassette domain-containing protein n=2 Tax=Agrobacterium pusense TaxID=648995 RepID=UPI001C6F118B|nr:ATP-binding cassette domain-containing protein [Agrobacterium pusense]MBW9070810.1 ATP-binding cassette domain-containing protein [Agrobacterium pusense]MBW9085543.1 ATP-binding cassette domain-containing protein [Agrobacterium pusense]MBW9126329.1 ATP-binding cassette domain-containing protein [Agrobacterium pusense]MBW9138111.1 ATP-binding cassette domain-containing protein [Agrobacterium pusense]